MISIAKVINGAISIALWVNTSTSPILPVGANTLEAIKADQAVIEAQEAPKEEPKVVSVTLTAYSSTPDQTDDTPFITAAGTTVRDGIVAANFLPLYTKIQIPEIFGDKVFVVEDRMAPRYQDRVDIWFPDRASAKVFGIKKADIVILEETI